MNKKHVSKVGKCISMACLLFVCATVQSCRDEYYYDDREPDFLGASIYDYLQEQGNFTLFLRVIDDLKYGEVLKKTGSKTLFVADDEAFRKGIQKWAKDGAEMKYEDLTIAQKRTILFGAMLDNAYLLEMLSKKQSSANGEPTPGGILRRTTDLVAADLVSAYTYKDLPKANEDWSLFSNDTVYMALDATEPFMLHLVNDFLDMNNIKESDLKVLVGDPTATSSDIYIYDKKIIREKSDVTCKNGYVHQLDGLLIPPSNMAEELRLNRDAAVYEAGDIDYVQLANSTSSESTTMLFSRMLDRYAVPVPIDPKSKIVEEYHRIYGGAEEMQLFEKRYYTEGSNRGAAGNFTSYQTVEDSARNAEGSLLFDPGWNAYKQVSATSSAETDMAAIFAPSDKAVIEYFSTVGDGMLLIDRYAQNVPDRFGTGLMEAIDSIPVDILQPLMRNLMQVSFVSSVPSKFGLITDEAKDPMGIDAERDVHHTIVANNGVVYVMNKLFAPATYKAVFAPVMLDSVFTIFDDIVEKTKDKAYQNYLLSLDNSFSLIATDDEHMVYYSPYDDIKGTADKRQAYRFEQLPGGGYEVNKYKYKDTDYDAQTNSYLLDTKPTKVSEDAVTNNLKKEILEYNIVIGDMNSDEDCASLRKYYMTKGNGMVMVQRGDNGAVSAIAGGRERQLGTWVPVADSKRMGKEEVGSSAFKLKTSMIQPPTQNVHDVLGECGERFAELCVGSNVEPKESVLEYVLGDKAKDEKERYDIWDSENNDIVRFFNTYHYTVYVPTDEAVEKAIAQGLPTWESLGEELEVIEKTEDADRKQALTDSLKAGVELLTKFIKYHFQDNAVFADNPPHSVEVQGEAPKTKVSYTTAALNDSTSRFCEVLVMSENREVDGKVVQTIAVRGDFRTDNSSEDFSDVNVCYVNNTDAEQENKLYNVLTRDIQFSGSNGVVSTSSYAVVHQIDGCLKFGGKGGIYDPEKVNPATGEIGMFVR